MKNDSSISARLSFYAILCIEKCIGILPTSLVWRIGAGLGSIAHCFAKKRRKIVHYNLSLVHPELNEQELAARTKEVFRYSMANLTSATKTSAVATKKIPKLVEIKGQDVLSNLDPDKGAICLLLHMGNWEILSRVDSFLQTDKATGALYRPVKNDFLDAHIQRKRERDNTKLFGRRKGIIQASKFLRDGNMLGILSDQYTHTAGVMTPLFGKETAITPLPAMLALKYDCPIIPVSLHTEKPGKWILEYHETFTIPSELDKDEGTKLIVPYMEKIMREHSRDIFWIHDLWKIKKTL